MSASPTVHVVIEQVPWETRGVIGVFASYDAAVRHARNAHRKEPNWEHYIEVWRGSECGGGYEVTADDVRVTMSLVSTGGSKSNAEA